jgi:hypothetical protein
MNMTPEDQKKHDLFVAQVTEGNPHIAGLFEQCAGRIMRRIAKAQGNWTRPDDLTAIRHIIDWLFAAVINDEPWLSNLDNFGRVKKLMKFSDIEQITKEANKAMLKAAQKNQDIKLVPEDEALEMKLNGGFYVVRLLTPHALDRESSEMQHCVGAGSYDNKLGNNRTMLFSLRDAGGKAHVTMEVEDGVVYQIQGKQNRLPLARYIEPVRDFCQSRKYRIDVPANDIGYLIDTDAQWHPLNSIPDGVTIGGEVDLRGVEIERLPKDMTIKGSLYISQTQIRELPEGLTVEGNLDLSTTLIERLGPRLRVHQDLTIVMNGTLKSLPENLEVGGNLTISFGSLEKIGRNLKVGGDIKLRGIRLAQLENVSVGRHFMMLDCNMKLAGKLEVGGNLTIAASEITKLPDDMEVGGGLAVSNTPLQEFPLRASVGGDVNMIEVKITEIPDNLVFKKSLSLTFSPLKAIPKKLKVKHSLNLTATPIAEVPNDLVVGGHLILNGTKVTELPNNLHVKGDLLLVGTPIHQLPRGLKIDDTLVLRNSSVLTLPDDISVGNCLDINETAINEIPSSIRDDVEIKGKAWMC